MGALDLTSQHTYFLTRSNNSGVRHNFYNSSKSNLVHFLKYYDYLFYPYNQIVRKGKPWKAKYTLKEKNWALIITACILLYQRMQLYAVCFSVN